VRVRTAAALLVALLVAPAFGGCAVTPGVTAATASGVTAATAPASASAAVPATASRAAQVELLVLGAASLKSVLVEAAAAYEEANPGVTITVSTDSSATLATQVEQGAPADVFLSADTANPQRLVHGGFAPGPPVPFARNELTVIVPADNPAGLVSAMDLVRPGVKIVAAGDAAPITGYATQLVSNLARQTLAPQLWPPAYEANVVSREDNVSAVLAKIELGEGDAAIVYATDALASSGVTTLPIPDGANVAATYAGVVVGSAAHPAEAAAFLDWLAGPPGEGILGRAGFLPAS
jgi:molybdate transport system substrate-binding protein